ncbi:SDR family NAD(P)-dependent oxidoreductase [Ornithinimicrobium cerasi]|uniref:Short-chain dehydrogenase n=1 Tax=Ornithinimicrobium cerasi TaxID=2248773 RepID=A0A285VHW9_9MICO|nr:SDR family NAD(P)-dependent oxidoreductase [Ornithinimicrobium cerasi]SOC53675.1 Short-chain dehydrogenase [Ornithinimicrobium cerasi]
MPTPPGLPVALVTGAGRGIGAGVALALSREGYAVALTARSREQLDETAAACPGPTLVLPADLTSPGAVDELVDHVEEQWAAPEVVVANAGAGVSASVERTTDEQWQQMLDLNLTAPFRLLRRTIPAMKAAGHGRIVVVASVAAKLGEPYISAYTASKHGVLGLVRSAAMELARTGVTVNAVCPGYVDTPMTEATVRGIVAKTGRTPEEARAALEAKQPINRLITVEEVVEAILTCVRNGGMTGQGLNVDGGGLQS